MSVKKAIFDKKNILVVGGAGFVGSHLCEELLKTNKVICVDNFITGDNANIAHLLQNPDFRFINQDIVNPFTLENFAELEALRVPFQGVQEVYFLASPTSPAAYVKYPLETLLVNSIGLRNILDFAVKYQAKFLFTSSPAVYGTGTGEMLIKESYVGPVDQLSPRAVYAEAKRFAEALIWNYKLKVGLEIKIARIFNGYGPRLGLNDGRIIPELIKAAVTHQDLVVYGEPNDSASYFFVADLVRGLIKLMDGGESGPVNLASEWKVSLREVADKIITLTQSKNKVVFKSRPDYFAAQPLADISLAKEKLGWFPIILLDDGLKQTIDYLSAQSGIRRPELVNK
jgi:nucleoside-diphosphate-sugar epimerase